MPDALATASIEDLRVGIKALQDKHPRAGAWLIKLLAQINETRAEKPTGTKRKADEPISVCGRCKSTYWPSEEDNNDCVYHPEELEVDWESDIWADHDENCHGPVDRYDNKVDHPEGFIWDCCDRTGDRRGCRRGPHVIGRYDDGDSDAETEDGEIDSELDAEFDED